MIIELPKRLKYASGDIKLGMADPYVTLTAIKNGAMLYGSNGNLIGQIFTDKKGATVTVADAGSYRVTNEYRIKIEPYSGNTNARYDVFGKPEKYTYTLYEYYKGEIKPRGSAAVTFSPVDLKDVKYTVSISEDGNIFRLLLLVVAITMLQEGENLK